MSDILATGFRIVRFEELESTNSTARECIRRGAAEGTVIVAERQSAGRGRQGRVWTSLPGALLFSLILRPRLAPEHISRLGFFCCVAAALAAEDEGLDRAWLKWPNDLILPLSGGHRAKWGGILVEAGLDPEPWAIAGVGLNIGTFAGHSPTVGHDYPAGEEPRPSSSVPPTFCPPHAVPGSLSDAIGCAISPEDMLAAFLHHFARIYGDGAGGDWKGALDEWRKRDWLSGRGVAITAGRQNLRGTAMGVDDRGALILDTPSGAVLVDAGEAHLHTE